MITSSSCDDSELGTLASVLETESLAVSTADVNLASTSDRVVPVLWKCLQFQWSLSMRSPIYPVKMSACSW